MIDDRISKMAKLLVQYCVGIQPGDRVGLMAYTEASPLVLELQREIVKAGGHHYTNLTIPGSSYIFYSEASDEQLAHIPETTQLYYSEFEALIAIDSVSNTRELNSIDPERQAIRAKAFAPLMTRYMERTAAEEFKWVRTVYPTSALAQDAEMSLVEYKDFIYSAMYIEDDDPIQSWRSQHEWQQKLVDWLHDKKELVVEGPDVDLRLSIDGRRFINSSGKLNLPDGEIFTSPIEDSVNGWIRFAYPAIDSGREISGVELKIVDGKVVDASAQKNEQFLKSTLSVDEGASIIGEFAVGTNKNIDRHTKNILFDEKLGGTIHLALGAGFPEVGGRNVSGVHLDMICDMSDGGRITVDGELFYDSGEFLVLEE